MNPPLPSLAPLDDQALLAELPRLARCERAATVALVARLAELDARRLYLGLGYPSADQYRNTITASREMKDELSRVQGLLRHQIPDGDPGKILARALSLLRQELEKSKLGGAAPKREGRKTRPGSRHVPAEVRRAVWKRDGGCCAFTARDGRRCAERGRLVPSHRPLRARRRGDGSKHLPPLSSAQRPRGRGLVRTPRAGSGTRSGKTRAQALIPASQS